MDSVTSRATFKKVPKPTDKAPQKAIFDSFLKRTWYDARRRTFYYQNPKTEEIREYGKEDLREVLSTGGFFHKAPVAKHQNGNGLSQTEKEKLRREKEKNSWLKFINAVWETKQIDGAGEIAGYNRGLIWQGNEKFLILKGPTRMALS
jgi:hypothetical protein